MPERRRGRLWIIGVLGLGLAGGAWAWRHSAARRPAAPRTALDAKATLPELAEGLQRGDGLALAILKQRLSADPKATPKALTEAEGGQWVAVLKALRGGFMKYSGFGKVSALEVTRRIDARFEAETAPRRWYDVLEPTFDLLAAGLADRDPAVRVAAHREVAKFWAWAPGRALVPVERLNLDEWKDGLVMAVVRDFGDSRPEARAAAVACLAALPLDAKAAPAAAYLHDPDPSVRLQVLSGFAQRVDVVATEAILPLLYDPVLELRPIAERVLRARGLSPELLGLAKLIAHPRAEMRASAIPLLKGRADVDPVVWLIHLSHDADPNVRAKAAAALASSESPEARRRLAEMAASDPSPAVRRDANPIDPSDEATAALPPLPGSPGLNPRAN